MIGFLLDEHLPNWWPAAVAKLDPGLKVWCIGDPGSPPNKSPDPVILEWCEAHGFLLVTNNRSSMPGHLADHVAAGRHVPGILLVDPATASANLAERLVAVAGASLEDEYRDTITYLPQL